MKSRSPIVYLDTSDYLNFYRKNPPKKYLDVYLFLQEEVKSGRVEIGYSEFMIWELLTRSPDPAFKPDRDLRAKVVEELCQGKSFPWFLDYQAGAKFPNDGIWVPRSLLFDRPRLKEKWRGAVDALQHDELRLNREQRRKLRSTRALRSVGGRISANGPLESADSEFFLRAMRGEVSEANYQRRMVQLISKPSRFIALYYDFGQVGEPFRQFFGPMFEKLEEAVGRLRAAYLEVDVVQRGYREARAKIREVNHRLRTKALRDLPEPLLPNFELILSEIEQMYSSELGGLFKHFVHYVRKRLSGVGSYQDSDLKDLMHLTHCKQADIFRVDRRMYNVFRDYPPFAGKLVGDICELPGRIESFDRIQN